MAEAFTKNNIVDSLEPEVTFLSKPPQIDGVLDTELKNLPVRTFNFVEKSNDHNPLAEVNYRLPTEPNSSIYTLRLKLTVSYAVTGAIKTETDFIWYCQFLVLEMYLPMSFS